MSSGDSGDEANEQGDDKDDQQSADERTKFDDEQIEVDNLKTKEYEELYGDVNISLKDVEPAHKEKVDEEMNVTVQVNVNQKGAGNQVMDDAQATQKTEVPIPSSSISSDYTAKYLNFDKIPLVDTEVVSMMDINVQHEAPRTSPLITIPMSVIPEHTVANPPEIVTTASSITIYSLLSSLFPHFQQLTPIPTPTTTEAITSTTIVPRSETLTALHQRVTDLEKDVKELKTVDHSAALLSTIKYEVLNAVKEYLGTSLDDALHKVLQKHSADITKEHYVPAEIQVPKATITSSDTTALEEFDQKIALFQTMTNSKSFNRSPKQRSLYHALMESILEDKDAMDEGVAKKFKKRKPDDADKDEGPSARSDRGLKRRKTSKDTELPKKAKSTKSSKGTLNLN
ncbi:hypothetical protein Tco_0769218 [Tanacetum coccineum]|uniref:Uncharacterized protein n=1 Tax=Tanacetum coccineum TaxID=301880 RepID=A0ABQ4Z9P9_9ASTR